MLLLVGKESNPNRGEWLQHTLKFAFGLSSQTWCRGEPTGQIQCVLSCGEEEEEDEHWRMSIEGGLTGGLTSVHQSSEPPCRVCLRQHQWRNCENIHFSSGFQILLNFQCSLRSLLWDWNSFSYVRLWTFLNATLSKIGTEQCWINLQTCLSANPQCSCCSSLVARWSSSFYWGRLGNFCLFRSCWVHRDHIGTIPRYHIKCIDLLQLLVWPS